MSNMSAFHPEYFLLIGIPGLEEAHLLISIPFCVMYFVSLLGNSTLLLVFASNESLHQPMYVFLAMLTVTDLLLSSAAVPKTLCIFWFNSHEILFNGCLLQIFCIHYLFVIESSIMLTMAYDRYVAICSPLMYTVIVTNSFIQRAALIAILRAFCIITPLILLLNRLPYQQSNIIAHTYCEHMAMARVASADVTINNVYGMLAASASTGVDLILIIVSYGFISKEVRSLQSSEARSKAFNTCVSHICVLSLFYIPAFFSFIAHRAGQGKIPPQVHILLANLYVIVPPMMNPIIYGARTKEIRQRLVIMMSKRARRPKMTDFLFSHVLQ
ncbi:olfactory receptor 52D1-like [Rana temporaria]|uniref:olfactory receptor 52D1-like n=1 Tax=Rana temporaria TaxID=8407 RepID=UPI001AACC202|nr:olfactory receptor 52D1-like [Rana temporaria]